MPKNFENQNEEEMKIEKKEISGGEFLKILNSPKFLKTLTIAGKETVKDGHETGFTIYMLEDGEFCIQRIAIGGASSTEHPEKYLEIDGDDKMMGGKSGCLLDFHFHPHVPSEGRIKPSMSDLTLLRRFSFIGVGQTGKYVEILLVRKKSFIADSEIDENAEVYREEILEKGFISEQEEVQEVLENNGFESFYIIFNKKKGKWELSEESEERISEIKKIKIEID